MVRLLSVCIGMMAPVAFFLGQARAAEYPNILVFLVDDMGLMDSSVPFLADELGAPIRHPLNDFYRTPQMERLAKLGARFSTFYAMSVCSPTRVSLMTGQTSARHHTTNWIRPESNNRGPFGPAQWQWQGVTADHVVLPDLLREAGYRTIHAGKAHFGPDGAYGELPQNFGFDLNIAGCADGQPGSYYGVENFGHGDPRRQRRAVPGLAKYHGQDIYLTEALTLEMAAAIEEAVASGQPFFAYMSHYAVHAPFEPDHRFVGNYPDATEKLAAFASMIEGIDKSLGDLLDHLERLGVAENTLVLFLGDNGTDAPIDKPHAIGCAAPLRGKKGTHYEGGMRIPCVAAWAELSDDNRFQQRLPIDPNSLQTRMGDVTDLFPTLLNATGIPMPPGHEIDGQDLSPLLVHADDIQRDDVFLMHFPHAHRSNYFTVYRRGDWKLVYHYHPETNPALTKFELFHLPADPTESQNLAEDQPAVLREMTQGMIDALEDAGAQYPVDKEGRELRPVL